MTEIRDQETRSYRDPLGDANFTTLLKLPDKPPVDDLAEEIQIPLVESVYLGFYQRFSSDTEHSSRFLVGPEGVIGSMINSRATESGRELLDLAGNVVGRLSGLDIERLNLAEQSGWTIQCRLVLSVYLSQSKSYIGETAWLAFAGENPQQQVALQTFVENIASRIAEGTHPTLALSQSELEQVIRSEGHWFMTKQLPLQPLPPGSLVYKNRRGWSDQLVKYALQHRIGCNIAAWLILAAIVAIVLFLVFLLPRLLA